MADGLHAQPARPHPRTPASLAAQHVEGTAHEAEPLPRRADPAGVFAVIIGKRIRDDEVPLSLDRLPEWQLVTVVIAVVEDPALGCDEAARVHRAAVAPRPAVRPFPHGLLHLGQRLPPLAL